MSRQQKILSTSEWKKVRLRVLDRDGHTCAYCGEVATHVDHVVPLSKDASDPYNPEGLVAACARCNTLKGDKSKAFFLKQSFTPPVFVDISLPSVQKPDKSPFIRP